MRFTGWDPELEQERLPHLRRASRSASDWFGDRFRSMNEPEELDPRRWHTIEDQGQIGSCQGNALSTAGEFAYWVASGGQVVQFSRWFAYRATQIIDGIRGDQGSTIEGGARCAREVGFVPESMVPYPRSYASGVRLTDAHYTEAAKHRMRSTVLMESYEDIYTWLAGGQGVVEIGIMWGREMDTAVVESFSGRGGGGHAVVFGGYSRRVDRQGRKYLWLANSWGQRWGNNGYSEVSPSAVEQMIRHRWSVMIGLSDLDGVTPPRPREMNFIDDSIIG